MSIDRFKSLLQEVQQEHTQAESLHRDSKVLIVDGMNLFIRTFSAIPTLNEDGQHVGGLVGFLKSLAATIRMVKPTRVVVVFDGKGGSQRRRKLYSNYKEHRAIKSKLNRVAGFDDVSDETESMRYQLVRLVEYLQLLPITTIVIDHIEADDVIAYLANYFKEKVYILSNDRDFLQLVSDRVNVYIPTKKQMYTPENLLEDYGVWSQNFILYKALLGDKSDNISGIRGMGIKTILKNLPQLSERREISLEEFVESCMLYEGNSKAMNELKDNIETFKTNFKLMQLADVDISESIKSNIRGLVDGDITEFAKVELTKLYITDKIQAALVNWDGWLHTNFSQLNNFRGKYATG